MFSCSTEHPHSKTSFAFNQAVSAQLQHLYLSDNIDNCPDISYSQKGQVQNSSLCPLIISVKMEGTINNAAKWHMLTNAEPGLCWDHLVSNLITVFVRM